MTDPHDRRVVVRQWGETPLQTIDEHLSLEQCPRPETLGPGEVLLRVQSCAVGWVDLLMMSGQYQHMATPPYTPGLEFAGTVEAVGDGVPLQRGARVLADGFQTGPRSSGPYRDGGFATWAIIPAHAAIPIPDCLSFDQSVNLLGNYETAYHALIHRGRLQAGEVVLVLGATGSTGLAAIHVGKLLGATVVAATRSPEKGARLAEEGADHVIVTGEEPLRDQVRARVGRVDLVWDGVGGDLSNQALRCLRFGGRFCIVGWAATPFVARGRGRRGAPNANQLPTNLIQMKGLDILGCPAVIALKHAPGLRQTRLDWLLEHVRLGRIEPYHGPAYALNDVVEALHAKWHSRHLGGCVLHP